MADTDDTALPLPAFERPVTLLLVVAPYYRELADMLVAGARATCTQAGAETEIAEVPGALEIPAAAALAHRMAGFDGYVALACVIRGETSHYETVCNDSARGLTLLGLNGAAIGNGILTVENREQAEARADPARGDKGGGAAAAALHLVALSRRWAARPGTVGFQAEGGARVSGAPGEAGR